MAKEKKRAVLIIFIAWLAYVISYMGRSDYSSCILEIVNTTGVARSTAGMVSSSFALCNAFGQLASGFVMKRIPPLKMIGAELFTVAAVNLLLPTMESFPVMAFLWGINGAMQATLLSGITQIFTNTLREPWISRGAVMMNTIGAVGGLFNYVLTFFIIRYFNWKMVFFTVAGMLSILGVIWCAVMPGLTRVPAKESTAKQNEERKRDISVFTHLRSCGTVSVIIGAFFVGSLRESVSLWIPSYLNETFRLGSDIATVLTAVVPCLQVCGAFLGGACGSRSKTLHFPAAIFFALSTICLSLIWFLGSKSVVVVLGLFVLNAISMTATLTLLLSLYPVRNIEAGGVAIFVGIINFSVHSGDFVASMGIGWLSLVGWDYAVGALCAAAVLGGAVCAIGGISCVRGEGNCGKNRVCK